jgi:hypothetical protein
MKQLLLMLAILFALATLAFAGPPSSPPDDASEQACVEGQVDERIGHDCEAN